MYADPALLAFPLPHSTLQGLLVSGMHVSALNMMRNLLHDISLFGFVPNGGRIYYLDRSQVRSMCLHICVFFIYAHVLLVQ